ncbi:MAG: GtrA family protein [Candidatus Dojkabacteria bacterium]
MEFQKLRKNILIVQFYRFFIVGVVAFFLNIILFYVLENIFFVNYIISTIIAFVTALIFNYILSMKYIFKGGDNRLQFLSKGFYIFTMISLVGLGLHTFLVYFMVDKLDIWSIFSNTMSAGIVMIYNFLARKLILFREYNE